VKQLDPRDVLQLPGAALGAFQLAGANGRDRFAVGSGESAKYCWPAGNWTCGSVEM
jgi:hypothetical protein